MKTYWMLAGLMATFPAMAAEPSQAQMELELEIQLRSTTVNTVMDYPGEPESYVADDRPDTLEVVFLTRPGQSEVREDGEVLFLTADVSDEDQQTLIARAFKLRAQKAIAARQR